MTEHDASEAAFVSVALVDDLKPGEMAYVEVGDDPVCLINLDGDYFAISDMCTHEEASLSDGEIQGDEIECPLHGGAFDIRTGQPVNLPVVVPVGHFRVRIVGDEVQVAPNR